VDLLLVRDENHFQTFSRLRLIPNVPTIWGICFFARKQPKSYQQMEFWHSSDTARQPNRLQRASVFRGWKACIKDQKTFQLLAGRALRQTWGSGGLVTFCGYITLDCSSRNGNFARPQRFNWSARCEKTKHRTWVFLHGLLCSAVFP
jgi:hypothetical protein